LESHKEVFKAKVTVGKISKGAVAKELHLTHLIDDKAACLTSFYY